MSLPARPASIVELDTGSVTSKFNRQPFRIQHSLQNHRLFELDRLVALSQALPESRVEFNLGTLPISVDPASTPRSGLSIQQTIKQIQTCQSWMALKQVQADPEYRVLLDDCLNAVDEQTSAVAGPMFDRLGFIFVSSPNAVTPFHIDPECNFLLQVHGTKTMYVFDKRDRDLLKETDLELFYSGGHRNLVLNEELKERAEQFVLEPGDGLHVPQHAPHYVENGADVSVSFSITFNTGESDRARGVYWCNNRLRQFFGRPSPPGQSPFRDELKFTAFRTIRGVKRLLVGKGAPAH